MSKIVFTRGAQMLKRKYGVAEPEYLVYADLVACGWDKHDAWCVAFQNAGITWPKDQLLREMNKLGSLEGVQKRIADTKGIKAPKENESISDEELSQETSKSKILSDLVIARKKMKEGTKEWIELTKQIADLARLKNDDLATEDNTIHYYLPVNYPNKCEECLIWQNGKAKGQKKNNNAK
ncbi:hypothetical protein [Bacteroides pyogenes]|uniref:hypothetical protein n=1 Tax=Bacteroides pyogenes TaxID=310300 RepID=UPI002FD9F7C9